MNGKTDQVVVRRFAVGRRYRCTLTLALDGSAFLAEWEPTTPERLTGREHRDYVRGRHELLEEAAGLLGGAIVVVDS